MRRADNAAVGFEGGERALLIPAHEPGVPNHIGGQDSGKPTLNAFLDHVGPLGHVPRGILFDIVGDGEPRLKPVPKGRFGSKAEVKRGLRNVRFWG